MHELIANLHNHTTYSDGKGTHQDIIQHALRAGIDVVIVTDHNVLVQGLEGYYKDGKQQVMLLVGEEIHDRDRLPQKNHLLAIGAGKELTGFAPSPQRLVDMIKANGGLSFLAHPHDAAFPAIGETDITWEDWQVHGFTGIEIWNGLSELKSRSKSMAEAAFYAFFPQYLASSPLPATLKKWDELLLSGQRLVGVGGADAHALRMHAGPIQKTIFPYEFHYHCINNHLLLDEPLCGEFLADRSVVLNALGQGHSFVAYDLPYRTNGFRFTAQGKECTVSMGDVYNDGGSLTFKIRLPRPAECRLLYNGQVVKRWAGQDIYTYIDDRPGVYRVECYLEYLGEPRGWIFSNPIYVRPPNETIPWWRR
ncbi:MAG: CehA/McbA family metallohydrolase [Anaerolineaceae bacterium]|nr:CehA/McbA family metallohydrolase [Anaerolineaceae bacterium]